ncbi:DNA topoisomerase 3-alpha [Platysternon megacephalum]|uniref:DNA topoisomerase 3-alpha n=1 Tax=Platysternon megacephalum TaxID=55544 RepID=A0A4D9EK45_9SAUR|nr:DNA topoisomerase 3-alpha [Platysternon megacephalum]
MAHLRDYMVMNYKLNVAHNIAIHAHCRAAEEASASNDIFYLYKHLHNLTADEKVHSLSMVYSSSGQIINIEAKCMVHWSEHFSQLLTVPQLSLDPDIKVTAKLTYSAQNDPFFTISLIK